MPPEEGKKKKEKGEAKKVVKRDKYAGMPRKKRRALQREEAFSEELDQAEGNAKIKLKLPNQKAAARKSKTEVAVHCFCQLPTTYHLPPTTYYLPSTTYELRLTAHY